MIDAMTDQHPLTDEIIDTLASPQYDDFGSQYDDFGSQYDDFGRDIGGVNTGFTYDDLRAAADWQLEQVIQAWEQCLEWPKTDIQNLLDFGQKLKAMRPTTTKEKTND